MYGGEGNSKSSSKSSSLNASCSGSECSHSGSNISSHDQIALLGPQLHAASNARSNASRDHYSKGVGRSQNDQSSNKNYPNQNQNSNQQSSHSNSHFKPHSNSHSGHHNSSHNQKSGHSYSNHSRSNQNSHRSSEIICHNCSGKGHIARDCATPSHKSGNSNTCKGSCFLCGQPAHYANTCPYLDHSTPGTNAPPNPDKKIDKKTTLKSNCRRNRLQRVCVDPARF